MSNERKQGDGDSRPLLRPAQSIPSCGPTYQVACTYPNCDLSYVHSHATVRTPVGDKVLITNTDLDLKPKPVKLAMLDTDPQARKNMPICTGVVDYFPLALAEVANLSKVGNDQHNPGQPLHWAKEKSTDHADCIMRHLIDRGTRDTDNVRHSAKLAWRALANLQIELERERDA